jgi:hypothetical protein
MSAMPNTRHVLMGAVAALVTSATAFAQSPNTSQSFRPGANHHIGDDAFIAKYHREPTEADEKLRMHEHFLAAKAILEKRAATKPELEARRKQILAAFDDYIAKGTTPKNDHLPWRTPVFIDDEKTICAVGYLIERTVGRDVAERVAATHRYSYLEEIAGAMPEVAKWVETSGFTLEELSTIQPGYEGPTVSHIEGWNLAKKGESSDLDGAYKEGPDEPEGRHVVGMIKKHKMEGTWTVTRDGKSIGTGELVHGSGKWHSTYPDGAKLAVGKIENNAPTGDWKFYHPDGVLAAEGQMSHGARSGRWKFYYDNADKRTLISEGSFKGGWTVGTWKHFDDRGKLLATSSDSNDGWRDGGTGGMYMLDIVPGADKVHHRVHEGNVAGDLRRIDELESANGEERLFVQFQNQIVFDQSGAELMKKDGAWTSADCGWDAPMKKAARADNLSRLHALIQHLEDEHCASPVAVSAKRGERLDAMLASFKAVRAQSPDFVRKLALGDATPADADADAAGDEHVQEAANEAKANAEDFTKTLASTMLWYVEFPHVDGMFMKVYGTIPGEAVPGFGWMGN